jgi:hypothetical protein
MFDLELAIAELEAIIAEHPYSDVNEHRGWAYWQTHREEIV